MVTVLHTIVTMVTMQDAYCSLVGHTPTASNSLVEDDITELMAVYNDTSDKGWLKYQGEPSRMLFL